MKEFYESNKDFRDYVDRYCKKYMEGRSITVEEALEHEVVRQVAEQYREMEESRNEQIQCRR